MEIGGGVGCPAIIHKIHFRGILFGWHPNIQLHKKWLVAVSCRLLVSLSWIHPVATEKMAAVLFDWAQSAFQIWDILNTGGRKRETNRETWGKTSLDIAQKDFRGTSKKSYGEKTEGKTMLGEWWKFSGFFSRLTLGSSNWRDKQIKLKYHVMSSAKMIGKMYCYSFLNRVGSRWYNTCGTNTNNTVDNLSRKKK